MEFSVVAKQCVIATLTAHPRPVTADFCIAQERRRWSDEPIDEDETPNLKGNRRNEATALHTNLSKGSRRSENIMVLPFPFL